MKHCTKCQHLFAEPLQVCPTDNVALRIARELEPGMVVRNKYIVQEWIGAGGMATVYRAKHRLLNEMRAVKVVSARFASDEDFLKRFRHEAAIARRLRHENAVWVEDLDEIEDGRPFIAMEFLEGDDLRKLIKQEGPLPVDRSLKLGAQTASALGAAHKLGIIHRDIKPDNIFVTRGATGQEIAKVLDFGIAKAKESVLQGGYTATKTGVIIGTPEYMSPEQAEGQLGDKLDGRSDLYSLGVVLYEMLTGQLPFKSDTPLGMCLHHLQTIPRPPDELRPDLDIPSAVSAILMKALEKRRERRFQSADEMLAALRNPKEWEGSSGGSAFTTTKVPLSQTAKGADQARTAERTSVAAAVAQKAVSSPQAQSIGRLSTDNALQQTREDQPPPGSRGKIWRNVAALAAVVVCLVLGYLLFNAIHRRNVAQETHDALVRVQILNQFQSSPLLQDRKLSVTFKSGTVTLSGSVPLPGEKDAAAALARQVPGVSDVINNIAITSLPEPAIEPAGAHTDNSRAQVPDVVADFEQQQQALKKPPQDSTTTMAPARAREANDLVHTANGELDQGNYAAAIRDFQKAMRLDPQSSAARSGLRHAQEAQKTEQEVLQNKQ